MQSKLTLLLPVLASLATTISARACHMAATVSQAQAQGCARCPPINNLRGTAQLTIDGNEAWSEVGTDDQYKALSDGNGYAWEVDGVSFHVRPMGIPALVSQPNCIMTRLEVDYTGAGRKEQGDLSLEDKLFCDWDWEC